MVLYTLIFQTKKRLLYLCYICIVYVSWFFLPSSRVLVCCCSTLLILSSYTFHTVRVLSSYCLRTILVLSAYLTHTMGILPWLKPWACFPLWLPTRAENCSRIISSYLSGFNNRFQCLIVAVKNTG